MRYARIQKQKHHHITQPHVQGMLKSNLFCLITVNKNEENLRRHKEHTVYQINRRKAPEKETRGCSSFCIQFAHTYVLCSCAEIFLDFD